jgi:hypothetical protein
MAAGEFGNLGAPESTVSGDLVALGQLIQDHHLDVDESFDNAFLVRLPGITVKDAAQGVIDEVRVDVRFKRTSMSPALWLS